MKLYDVIISGAGPAGSKCAEIIAKSGYKVALIEKNTKWRKPCGGAVSSRVLKYYPQLRKQNFMPITGIKMYSGDYHKFEYSWKGIAEPSFTVDRLEFDNFIRDIAIDASAEIFDNNISFDFVYKQGRIIGIKTKTPEGTKEYLGKIIVIADGMSSKLAIKSGLRKKWKINEIGLCKCAIREGSNLLDKSSISFFFRKYKGYGWIFPLNEKFYNIGCGTWLEGNLSHSLNQAFIEFINEPYIKQFFPDKNYREIWSGSYPLPALGVKEKSLVKDNIMVIGDAAGFVSPISGEGIHACIVSGNIAGDAAIGALESEEISNQNLKKFKSHPNIKKIIRNFKMKVSIVDFFYKDKGLNLANMFYLAETDDQIREMVINMFLFNQAPTRDFLLKLKSMR
ncbi:MAG: NAD(P)/FAD-dependent oxidoreductase [Promethearchaeota archaeon]|nr:MAG: NAD(P)/FAD-dependent oxidoreductase [Candidatus Lokiarchaeota archaeon]